MKTAFHFLSLNGICMRKGAMNILSTYCTCSSDLGPLYTTVCDSGTRNFNNYYTRIKASLSYVPTYAIVCHIHINMAEEIEKWIC